MPTQRSPTQTSPAPTPAPTDPAAQLQWLVDRAEVSDRLVAFAHALDTRDWTAYGDLYTEDGSFEVPGLFRLVGREQLAGGTSKGLGRYVGTWHLSANHAIALDGDTASTRSYLLAVHRLDGDLRHHADGAGWYDCTLVRRDGRWLFATVVLTEVWTASEALTHVTRDGPATA
ncbi:MAG TPA: nuclear transport factor 2 family protein [Mycobacteriales bacterium]|jgi:ketosteroid isomerase-like protein|nr:nuclear transport factor 2 family protein [Mycobacteriales bacterium]